MAKLLDAIRVGNVDEKKNNANMLQAKIFQMQVCMFVDTR